MTSIYNLLRFILLITSNIGILCVPIENNLPNFSHFPQQQRHQQQEDVERQNELQLSRYENNKNFPIDGLTLLNQNDPINLEPELDYFQPLMTNNNNFDRLLSKPTASTLNEIQSNTFLNSNEYNDNILDAADIGELNDDIHESVQHEFLQKLVDEIKLEEDIAIKSASLLKLLQELPKGPLPIIYVEDTKEPNYDVTKRSGRYYRRYPWKRQNQRFRTSSSSSYEADSKYQCVPSREDVFKLLVGLHENRNGNHHKTVHFCNRKRPAKAIFTNIRFLG